MRVALLFSLLCVCASMMGCGPVISTYLIVAAQADIDGATAAEAEKYAVYEYTAANEYIHKAREEQGFADFGPAIDYAYKAQDLAKKATDRANDEKKKMMEQPGEWQAPVTEGEQPSVIIKKKPQAGEMKVVPIPVESGPK